MKLNIKKELHAKTIEDLEKQLNEAKNSLRLMKFEHEQGRIKNTSTISVKKNEIAVMSTILNEKFVLERLKNEKAVSVKTTTVKGGNNE